MGCFDEYTSALSLESLPGFFGMPAASAKMARSHAIIRVIFSAMKLRTMGLVCACAVVLVEKLSLQGIPSVFFTKYTSNQLGPSKENSEVHVIRICI
jgi:hypothetical protein